MSAVGKILVFVVLVFSLLQAIFLGVFYAKSTPWADNAKKLEAQNQVLVASNGAFQEEARKAAADADVRVAAANDRVKKLEAELAYQVGVNREQAGRLQAMQIKNTQGDAVVSANQVEVARRQADTEKLRETLDRETKENARLVSETNKMRERAVAAEIQYNAVAAVNQRLEKQLQQTTAELVRAKANLGGGTAVARGTAGGPNPPTENVEGLIKATDPAGYVTITVGTDAGVTKGNTMEVFRLAPVASQSRYLGRIRIIEAGPNYAVGQPVGRMLGTPQVGDRVAGRILGG